MKDSLHEFFGSRVVELKRSEINPAAYNPRTIDKEGKAALKRSIKQFGVVGGIVVNARTNNTIVGGHQKVFILDEMYKYPSNDYELRVELIDVDLKTEKTLNVALNNGNIAGQWDYDALAALIPDIDYKDAGLTDADLNMIGVDYLLKTEEENNTAMALEDLMQPANEVHAMELEQRKEQREADRANGMVSADAEDEIQEFLNPTETAKSYEERKQEMIDLKQRVKEQAEAKAQNMDAYVMISFDTFAAKAEFCKRFGYNEYDRFIKGEVFANQIERID